jgi:hypothetical protein
MFGALWPLQLNFAALNRAHHARPTEGDTTIQTQHCSFPRRQIADIELFINISSDWLLAKIEAMGIYNYGCLIASGKGIKWGCKRKIVTRYDGDCSTRCQLHESTAISRLPLH